MGKRWFPGTPRKLFPSGAPRTPRWSSRLGKDPSDVLPTPERHRLHGCLPPLRPFSVPPSPATPGCPRSRLPGYPDALLSWRRVAGFRLGSLARTNTCAVAPRRAKPFPRNPPNPGRGFRPGQTWAAPSPARSGPRFDPGFKLPDAGQPAIQAQLAKRIPAETTGPLACPGRERLPCGVNQFQRGP